MTHGLIIESTRVALHEIDPGTHWAVWTELHGRYTIRTWIELAVYKTTSGWRFWDESMTLGRHDVPLGFLELAPAIVDVAWRDRVWAWHESHLASHVGRND